ncbi:MAG: YggS family pyridoxal phosphate-dependent enzyme [Paracoccaceae bacterium]
MSITDISKRITAAEQKAARPAGSARLIAVSKLQPDARVIDVLDQGHRLFGENRVQEAAGKWPAWREKYDDVSVHLLGPLQTNKTRQAFDLFNAIHSLDRPKLAKTIARLAQETGNCPKLFIQVNTGAEPQKAGVLPGEAGQFISDCRAMDLTISGLMCIPPADDDSAIHFNMLAGIAAENGVIDLSMGMSADFETAVACGATYIRVGSAIFGARG